jgi:SAM-dependent methyltransferase
VPSESYDLVLAGQVVEHVRKPWAWLPELARVTRRGGLVAVINPVSWRYHEAPVDCWRIYPEGMRSLFEEANLEVLISVWESLETPQYRRFRPGVSLRNQSARRRLLTRALGRFGFTVERAYDTITIGRKP